MSYSSPNTRFCHHGKIASIKGRDDKGIVSEKGEDIVVEVVINRTSACDGCHAKGSCFSAGEAESRARVLSVRCRSDRGLNIGDNVEVSISYRVGFIATIAAYILPLILFIGVIVASVALGVEQGVAALVAFAVMAIYYGGLYLLRGRFERVVKMELRRVDII